MRIVPALALRLFATGAQAQTMMLLGPSPESGFAGLWRFIGAKSAPWVKPRKLTTTDAPFLDYAVDFEDNEVKGPAALACKNAKYASGDTYPVHLFGGRLANDSDGAILKMIDLSQGGTSTYRVQCANAVRDYYMGDDADLVLAEGDAIYRLERPTAMDPEQYKVAFSGRGFDCTHAKTTGERMICGDVTLSISDAKLNAAFRVLEKSESPQSFATFRAGQRAWIVHAMKSCGADVPMSENLGDRNPIIECLNTEYGDQADLLDGLKADKAGALMIEPRMRFRTRANPDTEESDVYPWMSGGPQAVAFNAFIFKALKLDRWRMDTKSLFRYGNDVSDEKLHARRFYSVDRFDGRIVSLQIATSDFVGGHDEEHYPTSFSWNMTKARPISLEDVFVQGGNWKKFALGYCRKDLGKRTKADGVPADLEYSELPKQVADSANWSWGKDKATVTFRVFMLSGMPSEDYDVDIPYKLLKSYMKPNVPVL
jgi:uncharacterized protein YecT (DUF1311 family)